MLDHIEQKDASNRLRNALDTVLSDSNNFTKDLGGEMTTIGFTDAVIKAL